MLNHYLSGSGISDQARVIDCLFDGRFSISTKCLIDNLTRSVYPFPSDISPADAFVSNVPLINDTHARVSILMLMALAQKPIPNIADQKLLDPQNGINLRTESVEHFYTGRFYYVYTKPVMHGFHSNYAHPVGVSSILVSQAGEFRSYTGEIIVPQKQNNYAIQAANDDGSTSVYHAAELALAAWKIDPEVNSIDDIGFVDGNMGNFALSNLLVGYSTFPSNITERVESDPSFILS